MSVLPPEGKCPVDHETIFRLRPYTHQDLCLCDCDLCLKWKVKVDEDKTNNARRVAEQVEELTY